MNYFLTIAASDNSGGAGIQQDIKVAHDLGYWALSAISGITVQNFNKVFEIEAVNKNLLQSQIEQCLKAFPVHAIKIGAICNIKNLKVIAECLEKNSAKHIVLDPVLFSTSGKPFLDASALNTLKEVLFPLTELVTPNKPEFEILVNRNINTIEEAIEIAKEKCLEWNTAILLKGGHFNDSMITEALITNTNVNKFKRERKNYNYQHGTGCTLSSALACYLGRNTSLSNAYSLASEYLVKYYDSLQIKMF
jgi:hydroxymethylpyrimidine/phosphomethylpyrimidine kinase